MENFNLDNDRAERLHAIYVKLSKAELGEVDLSDKERDQLLAEAKVLIDADTKRYESDNEASSKLEIAEIEAKNRKETAEIEAKSRKEPWWKTALMFIAPVAGAVLGAAVKGYYDEKISREKMDRYEAQHEKDQIWEMQGTLTGSNKDTERHYDSYKQR